MLESDIVGMYHLYVWAEDGVTRIQYREVLQYLRLQVYPVSPQGPARVSLDSSTYLL